MHQLGIAGMPRRIPDYADAYEYLNMVATLGAIITIISLIIFLYIISTSFRDQRIKK